MFSPLIHLLGCSDTSNSSYRLCVPSGEEPLGSYCLVVVVEIYGGSWCAGGPFPFFSVPHLWTKRMSEISVLCWQLYLTTSHNFTVSMSWPLGLNASKSFVISFCCHDSLMISDNKLKHYIIQTHTIAHGSWRLPCKARERVQGACFYTLYFCNCFSGIFLASYFRYLHLNTNIWSEYCLFVDMLSKYGYSLSTFYVVCR